MPDNFTNIKIGNYNITLADFPVPIWIYIDEIVISDSCLTIDHFYPYPKYIHGFYPATDLDLTKQKSNLTGKTRYDIVNDAVLITRPVYFKHSFGWKDDIITKYRFDRDEPFTTSYFDKWMINKEHPGDYYKNIK